MSSQNIPDKASVNNPKCAEKVMIMFEPLNSDIELSDEDGDEDYIIESEHNSSSDESADENEEIIENSNEEEVTENLDGEETMTQSNYYYGKNRFKWSSREPTRNVRTVGI